MTKNKKLYLVIMLFTCVLTFAICTTLVNTNAKIGDYKGINSEGKSVIITRGEEQVTNLLGGIVLHKQDIGALKDCSGNYYYPFDSQYLVTQPNAEDCKIVTWSYRKQDQWLMQGVSDIARNFEENNPGWLVVGGTNADFFHINSSGEMDVNACENGEVIKPRIIDANEYWRGILGFTKENELIVGIPTMTPHYNVHVYENSEMLKETKDSIAVVNVNNNYAPSSGALIITKDYTTHYDLTGCKVYVGQYDLCRKSSTNDIYVKGKIVDIRDGKADDRPYDFIQSEDANLSPREFFLVSKDGTLDSLSIGDYVKVQKDYTGKFENVYNAASYYWKILENGKVMFEGHANPETKKVLQEKYGQGYSDLSYITCTKARCLFGVKADGSYVMCAIGGSTSSGMTLSEGAAFMKDIGCVDAWDFDGGGSATLVARTEKGIETINCPSDAGDGSERRVGNAIFMVVRDPGFTCDKINSTPTTVTLFKKTTSETFNEMKDIKVSVNGKTYEVADDQQSLTIGGLSVASKYNATIEYTYRGEKFKSSLPIETKKYDPNYSVVSTSDGFVISRQNTDEILDIVDATFVIDGVSYQVGSQTKYVVKDLMKDQEYEISYSYTYQNKDTGDKFTGSVAAFRKKTLSYDIPNLIEFKEAAKRATYVSLKYRYDDVDGLVTQAYILKNGEKLFLTKQSGTITINDLDFDNVVYVFKLVIEYEDPNMRMYTIESDELTYNELHIHSWVDATCDVAKHCKDCDETEGEPLGHAWVDADYENPRHCTRCGKEEGKPLEKVEPTNPTPEKPKKNCKKAQIVGILSSITLLCVAALVFKKRR